MSRNLRQLSPRDVLFVGGETYNQYQHTAGLTLLDATDRPQFGFAAFKAHMVERLGHIPQFRWRLHEVPLGLDLPYWVEDENFSFDNHIRRIAVPSPGDARALGELVAYLYSRHMDRTRPLWESWFIEGLPEGRYAVLQKLHHSMMDGEGAVHLGTAITDLEPDAEPRPVDPAIASARPGLVPEFWRQSLKAARQLSSLPVRASVEALGALREELKRRLWPGASPGGHPLFPLVSFNGDIGSQRGFAFCSLPLADIKAVKTHFDVTVNDVLLAVVSRALRQYLLHVDDLPQASLRTNIALSMRKPGDDDFSNQVSTAAVTLASDTDDPVRCLKAIAADAQEVKSRVRAGGRGVLELIQLMPPVLLNLVLRLAPPEQLALFSGGNLIVSNVRGSPVQTYVAGARITANYPMSVLVRGAGLNITCLSYMDQVDVGVTYDPQLFPDAWFFVEALQAAVGEYRALLRTRRKPARKSAARGKRKSAATGARKPARKSAAPGARKPARKSTAAAERKAAARRKAVRPKRPRGTPAPG